jgi:lysophospholipase L1-like esterase
VRLKFAGGGAGSLKIWNLGLYAPAPGKRNDYWLALGASIQNQSMRQSRFNPQVTRRFPKADPVLFNLAVRGWSSADLLGNLPAMLEQHPHAGYALIHIGGNDVSTSRPHDGGAGELAANLESILDALDSAGIVPILSRLSYRRYRGDNPVPPDDNGSGPYVTQIYDPLCSRRTPDFVDAATGNCAADFYTWFRNHPEELAADGIHLNVRGEESWSREWVRVALSYVYARPAPTGRSEAGKDSIRSQGRRPVRFGPLATSRSGSWKLRIRDLGGVLVHQSSYGGWGMPREAIWNLTDAGGKPVRGGVYSYTFQQGRRVVSGNIMIVE